jgi:hypothetical protein
VRTLGLLAVMLLAIGSVLARPAAAAPPADNMRNFAQIEQAWAQGVQTLATTFQTLYDTMSDNQKKAADAMFRHHCDHAAAHKQAPQ